MDNNRQIQEIMLRFLNGECTGEEKKVLEHWIGESKTNAEEFDLTKRLWEDTADAALVEVDTEKAWQSVQRQSSKNLAKTVPLFPWRKAIAIAASIILMAGIYYFLMRPSEMNWSVMVAQNSNKTIQLRDSTNIILREGSRLSLPENYGKGIRKAKLEGIAYFEIQHDDQQPFVVITDQSIITDIGTAFVVKSTDAIEKVTVLEGEVRFTGKEDEEKLIILHPGETAMLINAIPQKVKADTANLLSWTSHVLIFNNTPLSEVVVDLENYYGIEMVLPESLQNLMITAEFRNERLEQVLEELKLFTGLNFQRKGNTVLISKN